MRRFALRTLGYGDGYVYNPAAGYTRGCNQGYLPEAIGDKQFFNKSDCEPGFHLRFCESEPRAEQAKSDILCLSVFCVARRLLCQWKRNSRVGSSVPRSKKIKTKFSCSRGYDGPHMSSPSQRW